MKIAELINETANDDRTINRTARLVADSIIKDFNFFVRQAKSYLLIGNVATLYPLSSFNPELKSTPLGGTMLYVAKPGFRKNWQAMALPADDEAPYGSIYLNWKYFEEARDNPENLRWWLVEKLTHEIRHVLDYNKQNGRRGHNYWNKPHIEDEPETTQSEINAYFTQILHNVEDTIENNNITDVNRALRIGQEALEDSQLVDVIFGEWDATNPVLRRLSARMAQFVHSIVDSKGK